MSFYTDMGFVPRGAPTVGRRMRPFDEYYRCYPVIMMNGPDRSHANYGGKVFLPPSALDKLTRLHIAYPMLFELTNGKEGKVTHAGVLEFVAEEGRIYMPQWLMQTLSLEPGDLLQVRSTDLPPGSRIKLQPQSPSFLEISDPRAVLENAFRNFSCLTQNDIFQFYYNDEVYDIKVLEIKPDNERHAIVTMETDLEVDFATPVGYKPPERASRTSTPRTAAGVAHGGSVHYKGTMADSINYASIAPLSSSLSAADGAKVVSSHFISQGHRLNPRKGSKASIPSTPSAVPTADAINTGDLQNVPTPRVRTGPQPLRLPPTKLFFGYEVKPYKKKGEGDEATGDDEMKPKFQGQGQTLRQKRKGVDSSTRTTNSGVQSGVSSDAEGFNKGKSDGKPKPKS